MNKLKGLLLAMLLGCGGAQAADYEDGLRYKQEQKLEAAAAAFGKVLERDPRHLGALENLATVQGWLQRYDAAVASWQEAIRRRPRQPDYRVGLARVLYWKGERAQALEQLDRALQLAPDHYDAQVLRGDVLLAEGRSAEAQAAYQAARALPGGNDDAALAAKLERSLPARPWRFDAGVVVDRFDQLRGDEDSQFMQLGRRLGEELTLYGRYDRYRQFGAADQSLTAGAYWLFAPRGLLNVEAGGRIDFADFRPDRVLLANVEWLHESGIEPLLGYRYFGYHDGEVHTLTPGLRLLLERATLEARYGFSENVDGSNTGVFSARYGYAFERAAPYLALALGEEALPPQATADIAIYGAGCVWTLSPRWGLRADYSYEDRKGFYRHHAFGGGLTYRF